MLKAIRQSDHHCPELAQVLRRTERQGAALEDALCQAMAARARGQFYRGMAARILAVIDPQAAMKCLFDQLWSKQEQCDLYEVGLSIEITNDARAIRPLIRALHDTNPHRQAAAARALGWVSWGNNRAARELSAVLADTSRTPAVRAEAAEPLAYQHANRAIPSLLAALHDPDPQIRYWAVFSLGSISHRHSRRQRDPRVVPALEAMLHDGAVPSNQWNSVGQEALSVLANDIHGLPRYAELYQRELERIRQDPQASEAQRRWAGRD